MDKAISKNNIPVRLSNERWLHITTGHPETAGLYFEILETIENPLCIYEGNYNELIAVGRIGNIPDKFIVVVYKEISLSDGFVITAYLSNKMQSFKKKKIIWKQR
jgi:hypothetical protein